MTNTKVFDLDEIIIEQSESPVYEVVINQDQREYFNKDNLAAAVLKFTQAVESRGYKMVDFYEKNLLRLRWIMEDGFSVYYEYKDKKPDV